MRVCIYTAIYGGYDDLRPQPEQTVDTDFICFTDQVIKSVMPWRTIVNNDRPELSPRMRAKYFKILSHRVFSNGRLTINESLGDQIRSFFHRYDYVIWIDGSAQIKRGSFVKRLVDAIGSSGWALFDHPDRTCIYDEVPASRTQRKYDGFPLEEQVEYYRKQGYPAQHGLAACGIIARHTRNKGLADVNETWWSENIRWSYQDQLSLPFVLWRLNQTRDRIPGHLWNNELVTWAGHRPDKTHL